MGTFLQIGVVLGAVVGLIHALHLFRERRVVAGTGAALWFAVWTVALWTLFGAYVLAFWIIGALGMALSGAGRPAGAGR